MLHETRITRAIALVKRIHHLLMRIEKEKCVSVMSPEIVEVLQLAKEMLLNLTRCVLYDAHLDPLTGLYNRKALFSVCLSQMSLLDRRGYGEMAVLFLDLDHFKKANDRLGHERGDEFLKVIGQLLRTHARQSDVVSRYGGDEFVVVLFDTDRRGALTFAKKLRDIIEKDERLHFVINDDGGSSGHHLPWKSSSITTSIGISTLNFPTKKDSRQGYTLDFVEWKRVGKNIAGTSGRRAMDNDAMEKFGELLTTPEYVLLESMLMNLIKEADKAMFRAKQAGKNKVVLYRKNGGRHKGVCTIE